eukprot:TRINITY_DN4568_c0_g1_i1.p1 TRINITY_DN4568_c0_g1~~TRINITY_DN4568_c0_g1_i1.p1  ORF type:complete len:1084 (+),score=246.91 TRINITY_DN4568_c0_g1_i1:30-3281(+)
MQLHQGSSSSTEESSEDDGLETQQFDFIIPNFLREERERIESPVFGSRWQLLFFPRGFKVEDLSIFLKCCDEKKDWTRRIHFTLTIVHPTDPKRSFVKVATDEFNSKIPDRGFSQMTDGKFELVEDPDEGYLEEDGSLRLQVKLEVLEYTDKSHSLPPSTISYGSAITSRERTGFVGIENQGATCYLSTFLQTLYHIPYLRKAVYQMDTSKDSNERPTIILALQRLFYRLQFDDKAVDTKELTKSFGWDSGDVFTQHDAQELSRIFIDALETKMKGTKLEGLVSKMYEGVEASIIQCLNVDYSSSRKQTFYDISLNVKGCNSIYNSFSQYCEEEMLVGGDQYDAGEQFGKQDAKKCIKFAKFPPVLQIHLKRFELCETRYGYQHVKLNDFFKFPTKLKLDHLLMESSDKDSDAKKLTGADGEELKSVDTDKDAKKATGTDGEELKSADPGAEFTGKQTYYLHGILVHSGGVNSGHYHAYLRPGLQNEWFKFDDDVVTRVSSHDAVVNNYGGSVGGREKTSNAYMLIYVRKKDRHMYMGPCTKDDIPKELIERFEADQREAERIAREKEEKKWNTSVGLIFDDDILGNLCDDLCVQHVKTVQVRKDKPFETLHEAIEKEFGIPANKQRVWKWISRKNKTMRPNVHPISPEKFSKKLKDFRSIKAFYVEEVDDNSLSYPEGHCLIFLKYYDPKATNPLRTIGKIHVKNSTTIGSLVDTARELLKIDQQEKIIVCEEVSIKTISPLSFDSTLGSSKIGSGDILIFQKQLSEEEEKEVKFPDVPAYFRFLSKKIAVTFRPRSNTGQEDLLLDISDQTCSEILKILAEKLGADEKFIRLSKENYQGMETLDLTSNTPLRDLIRTRTLFFDVLNVEVASIMDKREVVVSFRDSSLKISSPVTLFISENGTVQEVFDGFQAASPISFETENKKLRLVGLRSNKIHTSKNAEDLFPPYTHNVEWIIEEISDDEINVGEKNAVGVVGFYRSENYGNSQIYKWLPSAFYFVFKDGEDVAQTRKRLEEKLKLPSAEFDRLALSGFNSSSSYYESAKRLPADCNIAKELRKERLGYLGLGCSAPKKSSDLKIESY